jgi:hypothetical protein
MEANEGLPLLHLDIHGRTDNVEKGYKGEVEVGAVSFKEWNGRGPDN